MKTDEIHELMIKKGFERKVKGTKSKTLMTNSSIVM